METVWRLYWVEPGISMRMQEFPDKDSLQIHLNVLGIPRGAWASKRHGIYAFSNAAVSWAEENAIPSSVAATDITPRSADEKAEEAMRRGKEAIKKLAEAARVSRETALDIFVENMECQGHPPGPEGEMGVTQYCDGSCRG